MTVKTAKKITARQKLDLSRLRLTQRELMGHDVGITQIKLQIGQAFSQPLQEAILDVTVERTIEGASTLNITLLDRDRKLLRSGRLAKNADIKIDGLWFRLVGVSKSGDQLTLTCEDREIAILRTYATHLKAGGTAPSGEDWALRGSITRAQFILRLIKEVKEFKIPWVIPELELVQPLEEDKQGSAAVGGNDPNAISRGKGIPHGAGQDTYSDTSRQHQYAQRSRAGLTVKGAAMSNAQIDVANAVLNTGSSMKLTWGELVMGIMCGIAESTLHNYRGGDRDSVGVFQQRPSSGWPASRNIARDATAFFKALQSVVKRHPNWDFNDKIQGVQNSGTPDVYRQYRQEAERIVEAYGVSDNFSQSNNSIESQAGQNAYHFYRGVPPSSGTKKWGRENSWHCITRLADEVAWRAFFVSGTFYYIDDVDLMQSKPAMILTEDSKGVESIDGQYDTGKKVSELNVTCRMGRWQAPPGSVVLIRGMGPFNGRWLVTNVSRSLFDSLGDITLKKSLPALPEPIGDTAGNLPNQRPVSANTGWEKPSEISTGLVSGGGTAAAAAKKLLHYHDTGKYRDDNGQQIAQLRKVAAGKTLHNQCGGDVGMDSLVLNALVALIEQEDMWVGTYALCEDHHCNDGQHPKGQAVDISSLGTSLTGWRSLGSYSSQGTGLAKQAMRLLGPWAWDLICNGVGRYDTSVQALQKDNGHTKGGVWESDHTNHIHFGIAPGKRD